MNSNDPSQKVVHLEPSSQPARKGSVRGARYPERVAGGRFGHRRHCELFRAARDIPVSSMDWSEEQCLSIEFPLARICICSKVKNRSSVSA
jgi:hypothetical protein